MQRAHPVENPASCHVEMLLAVLLHVVVLAASQTLPPRQTIDVTSKQALDAANVC